MKKWKGLLLIPALLAAASSAQNAAAQSPPKQSSSAQNSQSSATPVVTRQSAVGNRQQEPDVIGACAAAVDELKASRGLIDAVETENNALNERLETEKQTTALLTELNATRKSESVSLRAVIAAKNETIAAQEKVIASQDKLVAELKAKKRSPWSRVGDILIGAAIFAVLK